MAYQTQSVKAKWTEHSLCGGRIEGSTLVEKLQQRTAQQHQDSSRRYRECQHGAQCPAQRATHPRHIAACCQLGEGGQRHDPEGGTNHGFRELHEVPAPLQRAEAASCKSRGQVGRGQNGEMKDPQVQHTRAHQRKHSPDGGGSQAQDRTPAETIV